MTKLEKRNQSPTQAAPFTPSPLHRRRQCHTVDMGGFVMVYKALVTATPAEFPINRINNQAIEHHTMSTEATP